MSKYLWPTNDTTRTTCALCSAVLYTGPVDDDMAARLEQAHREGCEGREIQIGDYVRFAPPARHWMEGTFLSLRGTTAFVTVDRKSDGWTPIGVDDRNAAPLMKCYLRRIPRPEQTDSLREVGAIEGPSRPARSVKTCASGFHFAETKCHCEPRPEQVKADDFALVATPDGGLAVRTKGGEIPVAGPSVTRLSAEGQATYDRLLKEYSARPTPPILADADPELFDGLTRAQCYDRMIRRQREEPTSYGVTLLQRDVALTPAQLAAAREEWSAQLRAKVQAKAERERCAVTCDADDDFLLGCADVE